MGTGISVCTYGKDMEEAARVLYPTLKAVGYNITPGEFPNPTPDLDSLIIKIEGYGNYKVIFPPVDEKLDVVKASIIFHST